MAEPTSKGGNPIDPEKFFSMTAEERAAYMKTLQDNSAIVNKMNERPKNLVDISTGEMVGRRGNFDTYKDYGLNLRHDTDLDEALSYKQGTLEKIGKSAWNNVVGFGVGIVKGVTDMYDLLDYGLNGDTDPNMVSAGLNDFKEWAKGDVYFSKKDGGVWQDIGKVLASGTLGESASMIVPGMGISSAVSKLAAITRASIMHKALAMGANVAKMDVAMGSVASAFVGNAHESLMSIQEMSKTEADRLRASGMKEEQVQEKLAEMAKEMFYTNMVNVIPEALSMYKLLSKSTRVIDKIDPLYKRFGNTITQQMLPEAGQEIVNYFSEDQYKSHADEALGIGQKRDAFDEMIMKGRIFERGSVVSGIAGALGAPVFSAGTKGFEEFKDTGNIGSSIGAAFGGVTTAQRKKVAEQGDILRGYKEDQKKYQEFDTRFSNLADLKQKAEAAGDFTSADKLSNLMVTEKALKAMEKGTFGEYVKMFDHLENIVKEHENSLGKDNTDKLTKDIATHKEELMAQFNEKVTKYNQENSNNQIQFDATPDPKNFDAIVKAKKDFKEITETEKKRKEEYEKNPEKDKDGNVVPFTSKVTPFMEMASTIDTSNYERMVKGLEMNTSADYRKQIEEFKKRITTAKEQSKAVEKAYNKGVEVFGLQQGYASEYARKAVEKDLISKRIDELSEKVPSIKFDLTKQNETVNVEESNPEKSKSQKEAAKNLVELVKQKEELQNKIDTAQYESEKTIYENESAKLDSEIASISNSLKVAKGSNKELFELLNLLERYKNIEYTLRTITSGKMRAEDERIAKEISLLKKNGKLDEANLLEFKWNLKRSAIEFANKIAIRPIMDKAYANEKIGEILESEKDKEGNTSIFDEFARISAIINDIMNGEVNITPELKAFLMDRLTMSINKLQKAHQSDVFSKFLTATAIKFSTDNKAVNKILSTKRNIDGLKDLVKYITERFDFQFNGNEMNISNPEDLIKNLSTQFNNDFEIEPDEDTLLTKFSIGENGKITAGADGDLSMYDSFEDIEAYLDEKSGFGMAKMLFDEAVKMKNKIALTEYYVPTANNATTLFEDYLQPTVRLYNLKMQTFKIPGTDTYDIQKLSKELIPDVKSVLSDLKKFRDVTDDNNLTLLDKKQSFSKEFISSLNKTINEAENLLNALQEKMKEDMKSQDNILINFNGVLRSLLINANITTPEEDDMLYSEVTKLFNSEDLKKKIEKKYADAIAELLKQYTDFKDSGLPMANVRDSVINWKSAFMNSPEQVMQTLFAVPSLSLKNQPSVEDALEFKMKGWSAFTNSPEFRKEIKEKTNIDVTQLVTAIQTYRDAQMMKVILDSSFTPLDLIKAEKEYYESTGMAPTKEQEVAIRQSIYAIENNLPVFIKGAAGTGKTHTMKAIVGIYSKLKTGKINYNIASVMAKGVLADKKINESVKEDNTYTGKDHFKGDNIKDFFKNAELAGLVIVDEAGKLSGSDVAVFMKGVQETNEKRSAKGLPPLRLIFTGDPNQITKYAGYGNLISLLSRMGKKYAELESMYFSTPLTFSQRTTDLNLIGFQNAILSARDGHAFEGKNLEVYSNSNGEGVILASSAKNFEEQIVAAIEGKKGSVAVLTTPDNLEKYTKLGLSNSDINRYVGTVEDSQGIEFDTVFLDIPYTMKDEVSKYNSSNQEWYVASSRAVNSLVILDNSATIQGIRVDDKINDNKLSVKQEINDFRNENKKRYEEFLKKSTNTTVKSEVKKQETPPASEVKQEVKKEEAKAETKEEVKSKTTRRGDKQFNQAFDDLKNTTDPLKQLSIIQTIQNNIDAGGEITKEENELLQKYKDNLSANGYEIYNLKGKPFNQGMHVNVVNSISDENLEEGQEIITKVLIPQVNYNGKMVQPAQVVVSVGTKKPEVKAEETIVPTTVDEDIDDSVLDGKEVEDDTEEDEADLKDADANNLPILTGEEFKISFPSQDYFKDLNITTGDTVQVYAVPTKYEKFNYVALYAERNKNGVIDYVQIGIERLGNAPSEWQINYDDAKVLDQSKSISLTSSEIAIHSIGVADAIIQKSGVKYDYKDKEKSVDENLFNKISTEINQFYSSDNLKVTNVQYSFESVTSDYFKENGKKVFYNEYNFKPKKGRNVIIAKITLLNSRGEIDTDYKFIEVSGRNSVELTAKGEPTNYGKVKEFLKDLEGFESLISSVSPLLSSAIFGNGESIETIYVNKKGVSVKSNSPFTSHRFFLELISQERIDKTMSGYDGPDFQIFKKQEVKDALIKLYSNPKAMEALTNIREQLYTKGPKTLDANQKPEDSYLFVNLQNLSVGGEPLYNLFLESFTEPNTQYAQSAYPGFLETSKLNPEDGKIRKFITRSFETTLDKNKNSNGSINHPNNDVFHVVVSYPLLDSGMIDLSKQPIVEIFKITAGQTKNIRVRPTSKDKKGNRIFISTKRHSDLSFLIPSFNNDNADPNFLENHYGEVEENIFDLLKNGFSTVKAGPVQKAFNNLASGNIKIKANNGTEIYFVVPDKTSKTTDNKKFYNTPLLYSYENTGNFFFKKAGEKAPQETSDVRIILEMLFGKNAKLDQFNEGRGIKENVTYKNEEQEIKAAKMTAESIATKQHSELFPKLNRLNSHFSKMIPTTVHIKNVKAIQKTKELTSSNRDKVIDIFVKSGLSREMAEKELATLASPKFNAIFGKLEEILKETDVAKRTKLLAAFKGSNAKWTKLVDAFKNKNKGISLVSTENDNTISDVSVEEVKIELEKILGPLSKEELVVLPMVVIESKFGKNTKGRFEQGVISLLEKGEGRVSLNTARHEAFHKIWREFLTAKERDSLTKAVLNSNEYKEWLATNTDVTALYDKDDLVEEFIARKYPEFTNSDNKEFNQFKGIFRFINDIVNAILSLFDKFKKGNILDKTFEKINNGFYAKRGKVLSDMEFKNGISMVSPSKAFPSDNSIKSLEIYGRAVQVVKGALYDSETYSGGHLLTWDEKAKIAYDSVVVAVANQYLEDTSLGVDAETLIGIYITGEVENPYFNLEFTVAERWKQLMETVEVNSNFDKENLSILETYLRLLADKENTYNEILKEMFTNVDFEKSTETMDEMEQDADPVVHSNLKDEIENSNERNPLDHLSKELRERLMLVTKGDSVTEFYDDKFVFFTLLAELEGTDINKIFERPESFLKAKHLGYGGPAVVKDIFKKLFTEIVKRDLINNHVNEVRSKFSEISFDKGILSIYGYTVTPEANEYRSKSIAETFASELVAEKNNEEAIDLIKKKLFTDLTNKIVDHVKGSKFDYVVEDYDDEWEIVASFLKEYLKGATETMVFSQIQSEIASQTKSNFVEFIRSTVDQNIDIDEMYDEDYSENTSYVTYVQNIGVEQEMFELGENFRKKAIAFLEKKDLEGFLNLKTMKEFFEIKDSSPIEFSKAMLRELGLNYLTNKIENTMDREQQYQFFSNFQSILETNLARLDALPRLQKLSFANKIEIGKLLVNLEDVKNAASIKLNEGKTKYVYSVGNFKAFTMNAAHTKMLNPGLANYIAMPEHLTTVNPITKNNIYLDKDWSMFVPEKKMTSFELLREKDSTFDGTNIGNLTMKQWFEVNILHGFAGEISSSTPYEKVPERAIGLRYLQSTYTQSNRNVMNHVPTRLLKETEFKSLFEKTKQMKKDFSEEMFNSSTPMKEIFKNWSNVKAHKNNPFAEDATFDSFKNQMTEMIDDTFVKFMKDEFAGKYGYFNNNVLLQDGDSNVISTLVKMGVMSQQTVDRLSEKFNNEIAEVINAVDSDEMRNLYVIYNYAFLHNYLVGHHANSITSGDLDQINNTSGFVKRVQGESSTSKFQNIGKFGNPEKESKVVYAEDDNTVMNELTDMLGVMTNLHGANYTPTDGVVFAIPSTIENMRKGVGDQTLGEIVKNLHYGLDKYAKSNYVKSATFEITNEMARNYSVISNIRKQMESTGMDTNDLNKYNALYSKMLDRTILPYETWEMKMLVAKNSNKINYYVYDTSSKKGSLKEQHTVGKNITSSMIATLPNRYWGVQSNPLHEFGTVSNPSQANYFSNTDFNNEESSFELDQADADVMELQLETFNEENGNFITFGRNNEGRIDSVVSVDTEKLSEIVKGKYKDKLDFQYFDALEKFGAAAMSFPAYSYKNIIQVMNSLSKNTVEIKLPGNKLTLKSAAMLEIYDVEGVIGKFEELSEANKVRATAFHNLKDIYKKPLTRLATAYRLDPEKTMSDLSKYVELASKDLSDAQMKSVEETFQKYVNGEILIPRTLNFMDSDGYTEVIAPKWWANKIAEQTNQNVDELLRYGFAIRIPTTGPHSGLAIKIVAFTEDTSSVIAPEEIVLMHGSDYDVDALFLMTYTLDANGNPIGIRNSTDKKNLEYDYVLEENLKKELAISTNEKEIASKRKMLTNLLLNKKTFLHTKIIKNPRNHTNRVTPISFHRINANLFKDGFGEDLVNLISKGTYFKKRSKVRENSTNTKEYNWSRYSDNSYEVSSAGDERFSAFYAQLNDGRYIEDIYQLDIKGNGKAIVKPLTDRQNPTRSSIEKTGAFTRQVSKEESWNEYKNLWKQYLNENPELFSELKEKAKGKVLTDKFAKTDVSQARALAEILNESTQSEVVSKKETTESAPQVSEDVRMPMSEKLNELGLTIEDIFTEHKNGYKLNPKILNKDGVISNPVIKDLLLNNSEVSLYTKLCIAKNVRDIREPKDLNNLYDNGSYLILNMMAKSGVGMTANFMKLSMYLKKASVFAVTNEQGVTEIPASWIKDISEESFEQDTRNSLLTITYDEGKGAGLQQITGIVNRGNNQEWAIRTKGYNVSVVENGDTYINAYIDAVKEETPELLNATGVTIIPIIYLSEKGLDSDLIGFFMHHPVIKELSKSTVGYKAKMDKLKKEYQIGEDTPRSTNIFELEYMKEYLIDRIGGGPVDKSMEADIISIFNFIKNETEGLKTNSKFLNSLRQLPVTEYDILQSKTANSKESLTSVPNLKMLDNVLSLSQSIIDKVFPTVNNDVMTAMTNAMLGYRYGIDNNFQIKESEFNTLMQEFEKAMLIKALGSVKGDLRSYMEASAGSLPSTLNRTTKKLERPEQGKESLYSYINIYDRWKLNIFEEVTKLMNTEEYKDNMFLARLSLEIGKSNKVKIKFLIPKSALKNAVLRAKYSSEFLALPDELKDMLISYNILEDGAVNRYGAITQVITGDSEAINGNMNSYNEVIREYERLKEEIIETATKNNMPFFHDFFFTVPLAGNFDFKPLSKKFIEASEELTDYVEKLDIPSDYIFLKGVSGNFVIYGANRYYRQATFDKGISAWKKVNVTLPSSVIPYEPSSEPYTEIARNEFENLLTQEEYSRMKSGGIVTKEFKNLLRSNLLGENTDYYTRTPRNRKIALVKVKGSNTTFEVIKTTFTKNDGLYLQSTVSYEIYDDSVLEKEKINTTTIC